VQNEIKQLKLCFLVTKGEKTNTKGEVGKK
jgi:hypothetical protein